MWELLLDVISWHANWESAANNSAPVSDKEMACEEQLSHLDELTLETPSVGGEVGYSMLSMLDSNVGN